MSKRKRKLSPANKQRRKQYRDDEGYREKIKEQERNRYAKRNPKFKPKTYGIHAGKATSFSQEFYLDGELLMALTIADAAKVFGVTDKVLYQWIKTGKVPRPIEQVDSGAYVYHIEEVDAMAAVLKRELKGRGAFRPTDISIMKAVHLAFATTKTTEEQWLELEEEDQ